MTREQERTRETSELSHGNGAAERDYPPPCVSDIRGLAERAGPVLSLFVPVTAAVPDVRQNPVRHARVVAAALERWSRLGADASQIEQAQEALAGFAVDASSPAAGVAGRAAFWSADAGLECFGLPFPCGESSNVARCARLRAIARAAQRPGRYRVLTLSANRVALYEGDEATLERVPAPELPDSLETALGHELSDPSVQFHSGGRGGGNPVYHGQGGAPRERRVDLERFHQRVARALEAELGEDVVPLVLAADARHRPVLEQALSRDIGLLPDQLEGNADHMSATSLHAATRPIVAGQVDVKARLREAREGPRPPLTRISEIASHAVMGRIHRLWVPAAGSIPGRLDRTQARASEAWGDDDLLESLIVEVVRRGGSVLVLEGTTFPDDPDCLAAELR